MSKTTFVTCLGLLLSACADNDPDTAFVEKPPPQNLTFCETEPRRSDSLVTFSEPIPPEASTTYEIWISAAFENFPGEFAYPSPFVCQIISDEKRKTEATCPNYHPTVEEFRYDNVPLWQYTDDGEAISGFRWPRIVETADIVFTRDGEEIFSGSVDFTVNTSECPEHVFDVFDDHPEYGEAYRYAMATVDTSD